MAEPVPLAPYAVWKLGYYRLPRKTLGSKAWPSPLPFGGGKFRYIAYTD